MRKCVFSSIVTSDIDESKQKNPFGHAHKMKKLPYQSLNSRVRFPGAAIAARDIGVSRAHLHAVLTGQRISRSLEQRWQQWLCEHSEFASIQPRAKRRK